MISAGYGKTDHECHSLELLVEYVRQSGKQTNIIDQPNIITYANKIVVILPYLLIKHLPKES